MTECCFRTGSTAAKPACGADPSCLHTACYEKNPAKPGPAPPPPPPAPAGPAPKPSVRGLGLQFGDTISCCSHPLTVVPCLRPGPHQASQLAYQEREFGSLISFNMVNFWPEQLDSDRPFDLAPASKFTPQQVNNSRHLPHSPMLDYLLSAPARHSTLLRLPLRYIRPVHAYHTGSRCNCGSCAHRCSSAAVNSSTLRSGWTV